MMSGFKNITPNYQSDQTNAWLYVINKCGSCMTFIIG